MIADLSSERLILVLDASPDHTELIQAVLQRSVVPNHVVAIADGQQALDYLYPQSHDAPAPRPDLILLNLDLPGQDGWEILRQLKADPHLKRIPIIVLTASNTEADIRRSYVQQGNCYVLKPSDLEQLEQIVQRIEAFWLEIVTLPHF